MGSGIAPKGLGFVLQDRGELFDLAPDRPNSFAPGKRPFHTIIPAFVTRDGNPWMAFGVMGGAFQPQGHVQILIDLLDFDMGLQEAGDAPRIAHFGSSQPTGERMLDGGAISVEAGFDEDVMQGLRERGHRIVERAGVYGGYQAIQRDAATGGWIGATESRKDGSVEGF